MRKILFIIVLFISCTASSYAIGTDLTSSLLNEISEEVNYANSIANETNASSDPLYKRFHQGITSPPGTLPSFSVGQAFYAEDYNNIKDKLMAIEKTINAMANINQTTEVSIEDYPSKSNGDTLEATLYSTMYYQALELRSAIKSVKNTMCPSDEYRPGAGSCKNVTEFGKFSYASDNRIMDCTNGPVDNADFHRLSVGGGSPTGCNWLCNYASGYYYVESSGKCEYDRRKTTVDWHGCTATASYTGVTGCSGCGTSSCETGCVATPGTEYRTVECLSSKSNTPGSGCSDKPATSRPCSASCGTASCTSCGACPVEEETTSGTTSTKASSK